MKKIHLLWIIPITLFIGIILSIISENLVMEEYDLYNCIYYNTRENNFPMDSEIIKKIQDECICFREHNYTNVFDYC